LFGEYPFENGKKLHLLRFLWFVEKVPAEEILLRHWVKNVHAAGRHLTGNHLVLVTNFRQKDYLFFFFIHWACDGQVNNSLTTSTCLSLQHTLAHMAGGEHHSREGHSQQHGCP